MGKVHNLPPHIVSKIAAGEVIERPASVVKELLENAIDAGADSIEIDLQQSGKKRIVVKDNGSGIEEDDMRRIFLRHSTSKVATEEDLYSIYSLGFRGEALYSIAAVSDIVLRSKVAAASCGWEIHMRGGEELACKPVNISAGTEIEVKELFFNTPARKKFLKSDTTELSQVLGVSLPYALLYPQKRFIVTHCTKFLLSLTPDQDLISRASQALHLKADNILFLERNFSPENISFRALLGDINIQRARKDLQYVFVNNRPVYNRTLSYHFNQMYRLLLPGERYPFFAVFIDLPAESVDANIHPTKREVRIANELSLIGLIKSVCEEALVNLSKPKQVVSLVQGVTSDDNFEFSESDETVVRTRIYDSESAPFPLHETREGQKDQQYRFTESEQANIFGKEGVDNSFSQKDLKTKLHHATFIGSFHRKYLFFETSYSLLVIDQHAAQERITYEQLRKQIDENRLEVQQLLSPILISVSPQELVIYEVVKETMDRIGLSTTLWDNQTVALHAYPHLISKPEIAVRNLLSGEERTRFDDDTLARRACRNSLMAGYEVSREQAHYLIEQLLHCDDPFTCPHGRPTVIEIQEHLLSKPFLRT